MDKRNFTSVSQLPAKLFATECVRAGKIMPVHIQLCPTNKCNLNCSFCSCAGRDKSLELPYPTLERFIWEAANLGTKAITITGGGEPLMYPDIGKLIECCCQQGIKVGLVTNGFLLHRIDGLINKCTWIRISMSDDRPMEILDLLVDIVEQNHTDWAFSYVASASPNMLLVEEMVAFANQMNFTHIRFVSDLLNVESTSAIVNDWGSYLSSRGIDISRIIFQKRDDYTKGQEKCLISLLKPLITPSGHILACCGWQYRHDIPSKDLDTDEAMGTILDFRGIIETQACFNGSDCQRCYYSQYNNALDLMTSEFQHKEFL